MVQVCTLGSAELISGSFSWLTSLVLFIYFVVSGLARQVLHDTLYHEMATPAEICHARVAIPLISLCGQFLKSMSRTAFGIIFALM